MGERLERLAGEGSGAGGASLNAKGPAWFPCKPAPQIEPINP